MAYQHPGPGPGSGDVQNRRSILQGLQQTRSRLQRMHNDEPKRMSPPAIHPPLPSHAPRALPIPHVHNLIPPPVSRPTPQQLSTHRAVHASPSPNEHVYLAQQQKMAIQQANSTSYACFLPQPSAYGNILLPVLPRFDSMGQLETPNS